MPNHDIENRLFARIEQSEARLGSVMSEMAESLRAADRAAVDNASRQRRLFVSLRSIMEEQSLEIIRLKNQLAERETINRSGT